MQARLDGAVASNAPQYELGIIRDEMNTTEYASNPRMMSRLNILKKLEPYPNLDLLDISTLYAANRISQINFELKYNFTNFIAQFEDENGNIVDFASLLTMSKKIEIIKTKLLEYVKESISQYSSEATGTDIGQGTGKTLQVAS
jgi:hypothetical protein